MSRKNPHYGYLIAAAVVVIAITVLYFLMTHAEPEISASTSGTDTTDIKPQTEPVYSVAIFQARGDTIILRNTGNTELTNETMKVSVDGEEQPCTWSLRT